MASDSLPLDSTAPTEKFQIDQAAPVLAGHFVHDTYAAMTPTLLPVLMEKLALNLTGAGSLSAVMQLPGLLNPLIGYMADKVSVRYFIILAPALTATLVSLIGLAPGYWTVVILLFAAGVSTAMFHAPAPAVVARASGRKVGLGMSMFMATGELGYALGPLLAVWAVTNWTLEGLWRLMFLGWAVSLWLFWQLNRIKAPMQKPGSLKAILPGVWRGFVPIIFFNLFRNPLTEALTTCLPTYMNQQGASLWIAGSSLAVVELSGVPGALLMGMYSDRLGRKRMLSIAVIAAAVLMLIFLRVDGWLQGLLLVALGFSTFATMPVIQAIVQEQFPNNRAVANGLFMMVTFALRPVATFMLGMLGDWLGLPAAYLIAALASLLMLPAVWALPNN